MSDYFARTHFFFFAFLVFLPVFASVLVLFLAFVCVGPVFLPCARLSLGFSGRFPAIIFMERCFLDSRVSLPDFGGNSW